jgi:hypothetical protein
VIPFSRSRWWISTISNIKYCSVNILCAYSQLVMH